MHEVRCTLYLVGSGERVDLGLESLGGCVTLRQLLLQLLQLLPQRARLGALLLHLLNDDARQYIIITAPTIN